MKKEKIAVVVISAYLIVRQVVNLVLANFPLGQLVLLLVYIILAILMMAGTKYTNYITSLLVMIIAAYHLPLNIRLLPTSWLYLTEGILDITASILLAFHRGIEATFHGKSGDA